MANLSNQVQIIFKALDQTGPGVASVKNNMDGAAASVKKFGGAMDVAMGVIASQQMMAFSNTMSDFLVSSINEAGAAQDAMAQLEQVIESTGGAAGLTAEEVDDMATAFSQVTRFEDDAIVAGQTILLQFTDLGKDVFPRATQAMLDLSTRMKVDLPNAAKIVGRALSGEFGALTRYGIQIDDATQKAIKGLIDTGKTAEAQELILKELEKRFGGAAEAAGNTFAGKMEILGNAWRNFKESIGGALAENESFNKLLEKTTELLVEAAEAFENLPDGVQIAIVGIVGLVATLGKLAPVLISAKLLLGSGGVAGAVGGLAAKFSFLSAVIHGTLLKALAVVGGVLGGITAPVWLLIAAIALLIAVIVEMGPTAKKTFLMIADIIAASLKRAGYEIKKFAVNAWADLRNMAAKLVTNVKTWFQSVGKGIVDGIKAGIQGGWEGLKTWISNSLDTLLKWVKDKLGIKSPSKLFEVEVGLQMAKGIGVGFQRGLGMAAPAMSAALMPSQIIGNAGGGGTSVNGTFQFFSPITHAERLKIRKEQIDAAERTFIRATR